MTLPGGDLRLQDLADRTGDDLQLATPFLLAETYRGPDEPRKVTSRRALLDRYGPRDATTAPIHDWVSKHLDEGGAAPYVLPLRGPAATRSQAVARDASNAISFTVRAVDPGAAGDDLSFDIELVTDGFTITVLRDDIALITSPVLADAVAARAWSLAAGSLRLVEVVPGVGGAPVATGAAVALTGGDDDRDGITIAHLTAQMRRFVRQLGAGVLVLPGRTSPQAHIAMTTVASELRNRLARCDLPAVRDPAVLAAHAAQVRVADTLGVADLIAPPLTGPGLTSFTTQQVPGSVLRTACEARNDRAGVSPNQPAAGRFGIALTLTGVLFDWDEGEREILNDAGVNVARVIDGQVRLFGARTATDPETNPVGIRLGSARMRMAVAEITRRRVDDHAFVELDAGGIALGELEGLVSADIRRYRKSLYKLTVSARLEDGPLPGEYVVLVDVELQVAPDAEVIVATITRTLTEV